MEGFLRRMWPPNRGITSPRLSLYPDEIALLPIIKSLVIILVLWYCTAKKKSSVKAKLRDSNDWATMCEHYFELFVFLALDFDSFF